MNVNMNDWYTHSPFLQGGAATCSKGFVTCFLKVPLACLGSMAAAVQPNSQGNSLRKQLKKPSEQVAAPFSVQAYTKTKLIISSQQNQSDQNCILVQFQALEHDFLDHSIKAVLNVIPGQSSCRWRRPGSCRRPARRRCERISAKN